MHHHYLANFCISNNFLNNALILVGDVILLIIVVGLSLKKGKNSWWQELISKVLGQKYTVFITCYFKDAAQFTQSKYIEISSQIWILPFCYLIAWCWEFIVKCIPQSFGFQLIVLLSSPSCTLGITYFSEYDLCTCFSMLCTNLSVKLPNTYTEPSGRCRTV